MLHFSKTCSWINWNSEIDQLGCSVRPRRCRLSLFHKWEIHTSECQNDFMPLGIQTGNIYCWAVVIVTVSTLARFIKPVSLFSFCLSRLLHNKRWFVCKLQEQRRSFLLPLRIHPSVTLNSHLSLRLHAECLTVCSLTRLHHMEKHILKGQYVGQLNANCHAFLP